MVSRLDKMGPVAAALAIVAYCCWPYLGGPAAGTSADSAVRASTFPAPLRNTPEETEALSDPFRLPEPRRAAAMPSLGLRPPAAAANGAVVAQAHALRADVAALVKGLELNATYIRGQRRAALISGHVYDEGEALKTALAGMAPCMVVRVEADRVVLRQLDQTAEVRYADRSRVPPARPTGSGSRAPRR